MNEIQNWAVTLCAAGIGCSLLRMLCPKGAMSRVFGVLTAVLFFCCLLLPLQTVGQIAVGIFQTEADDTVPQELDETVKQQITSAVEQALLDDAKERLENDGVQVKRVAIVGDIDADGGIYIERVKVTFAKDDRERISLAATKLEQAWGRAVDVYYVDG